MPRFAYFLPYGIIIFIPIHFRASDRIAPSNFTFSTVSTLASQGTRGMRTVSEARLMMKPILPMPPAFCAPVSADVS